MCKKNGLKRVPKYIKQSKLSHYYYSPEILKFKFNNYLFSYQCNQGQIETPDVLQKFEKSWLLGSYILVLGLLWIVILVSEWSSKRLSIILMLLLTFCVSNFTSIFTHILLYSYSTLYPGWKLNFVLNFAGLWFMWYSQSPLWRIYFSSSPRFRHLRSIQIK